MKKYALILFLGAALSAVSSCDENYSFPSAENGYLSIGSISIDDFVTTRASSAAPGTYVVNILDQNGTTVFSSPYSSLKDDDRITLAEGKYTIVARSISEDIPAAAFEQPVYGASESFTITAGKTTSISDMVCTLLQTKVTVDYSDEFLSMVTGDCKATVYVTASNPLVYSLNYNGGRPSYDKSSGYFYFGGTSSTTLEIDFSGSIEGANKTMAKIIKDVSPRSWHQIKFIKKSNSDASADFDITIDGFIADSPIDADLLAKETVIGDDPDAPKGDGDIKLVSTCGVDISRPVAVPALGQPFNLTLKAEVPGGVRNFTVDISSTNDDFIASVKMVNDGQTMMDLINPSAGAIEIFTTLIPFPYGESLRGKTEVPFDLTTAQEPILGFAGSHTFTMQVTDCNGCRNAVSLTLVVE